MTSVPPGGTPLPGTAPPPPPPSSSTGLYYRGPPPSGAYRGMSMSSATMTNNNDYQPLELEDVEDANQHRYNNLLTAVVVLGLLTLAAVAGLFIFTGIELSSVKNTVESNQNEIEDIWKFIIKNDRQDDKDLDKLEKWVYILLWKTTELQKELDEVKNCTNQIKEELANITDCSEIEKEVEDIKNCTLIIKDDLNNVVEPELISIRRQVVEVKDCTEIIKTNISTVNDEVELVNSRVARLGKLPLARVICGASEDIQLPTSVNVLISANMNPAPLFPITSVDYSVEEGAIVFTAPNINPNDQVILHLQARVLVSDVETSPSTFFLIASTNATCNFGDCDDGIYSTSVEYIDGVSTFGTNKVWLELNTKINVDGSGTRFYFFVRSNQGGGVIRAGDNDATACASLWLSFEAIAPTFTDANP